MKKINQNGGKLILSLNYNKIKIKSREMKINNNKIITIAIKNKWYVLLKIRGKINSAR